jgi:hypothetical protein
VPLRGANITDLPPPRQTLFEIKKSTAHKACIIVFFYTNRMLFERKFEVLAVGKPQKLKYADDWKAKIKSANEKKE